MQHSLHNQGIDSFLYIFITAVVVAEQCPLPWIWVRVRLWMDHNGHTMFVDCVVQMSHPVTMPVTVWVEYKSLWIL